MPYSEPRRPADWTGGTRGLERGVPVHVEPESPDAQRVRDGELPSRYADPWRGVFIDRVRPVLRPNMTILDVGAGRRPTLPTEWRPSQTHYIGLDLSGSELAAAEPGAYDQIVVGDVGARLDQLAGKVDLIVCWQVLEHVADLAASLDNMRTCLRLGGRMVSLLSGSRAAFALIAQVMPHPLRVAVMAGVLQMDPDTKFKTHYDRCYYRELHALLSSWTSHEVLPLYRGACYVRPWRSVERLYLAYENWLVRTDRRNLATHYLIVGDV